MHLDEWPFNRKKAKPQNCLTGENGHATTCNEQLMFVLSIERSSPLEKATHLTVKTNSSHPNCNQNCTLQIGRLVRWAHSVCCCEKTSEEKISDSDQE